MRARHLAVLAVLALAPLSGRAATITIVNNNAAGVGFNDPTPAAPVGGNSGTTLGQQRLNAFEHAAAIWAGELDSIVPIRILASFEALTCTATSAVLGSAGTLFVFRDFPGAGYPAAWYGNALANKLSGVDLTPDEGASNLFGAELRARFNVNLGVAGCLTGTTWYLGYDANESAAQIDLVAVLLHEFAHGFGFQSFTSVVNGAPLAGFSDVYSKFYYDQTQGKMRDEMTDAERRASAINPRNVVWTGNRVTTNVPSVLASGTPVLAVASPASVAGDYAVGAASFGPPLASPGVAGGLVVALDPADAAGPTTNDACSPISNAADVSGKIAVVTRGTCTFVIKVKNAQNAGAIGVVVTDNVAGGPPAGLGGADPTITIPSVRVTLADGNKLRTAIAGGPVAATLGVDPGVRAGANRNGFVMLYTPDPVAQGSTISHWDTSTFPNQLMEPAINADLTHSVKPNADLTVPLLRDIGWYVDGDLDFVDDEGPDQCLGSDLRATVIIGGVDTGVPNEFFTDGCSIVDRISACAAAAAAHGDYVSCASAWTNTLKGAGVLTGAQKGAIQRAVAQDKNP